MRAARSQELPFRVFPDLCLPALSLLPGHRPAQLAQWAAWQDRHVRAKLSDEDFGGSSIHPGIVSRRVSASSEGARTASICPVRLAIDSSK